MDTSKLDLPLTFYGHWQPLATSGGKLKPEATQVLNWSYCIEFKSRLKGFEKLGSLHKDTNNNNPDKAKISSIEIKLGDLYQKSLAPLNLSLMMNKTKYYSYFCSSDVILFFVRFIK